MPVVLTDRANKVWCAEDPLTGQMLIGLTGKGGIKVQDALEFITKREKQFQNFMSKKRPKEGKFVRP